MKVPRSLYWGIFLLLWGISLCGQGRPGGAGGHFSVPNIPQKEAMEILEHFRTLGLENDFSLHFTLKHLPRRGKTIQRQGRMWGTFTSEGPISLFELYAAKEGDDGSTFLLVKNGRTPKVWISHSRQEPLQELPEGKLFDPLIEGFLYSAFDAMMPFIFWDQASYKESKRILGRRAHLYELEAPHSFKEHFPEIGRVELALDGQFNALLQAKVIARETNRPLRTFSVLSFKKAGEQYIVGVTEMREEQTRDRTLLEVTSAALNILLPKEMFEGGVNPRYPDIPSQYYLPVQ